MNMHVCLNFDSLARAAKSYLEGLKRTQAEAGESDDEAIAERLRQEALDSLGHLRRRLAHRLRLPPLITAEEYRTTPTSSETQPRMYKGHRLSVTSIVLTNDDRTLYSVSKDGAIFEFDVESGQRRKFMESTGETSRSANAGQVEGADWVKPAARQGSRAALLSVAVSHDGRYLATGGGDKLVHVWDARSGGHIKSFPGHKDAVTALVFREGSHQLFSGSLDRSVKIWSLEDMAYVDTLFGHQAEVLSLDALRAERVLSSGADRTCRIFKIPEESQLVFRGHCLTMDCAAYISGSEWVTGSADGSVQLWHATKKKPVWTNRNAHGPSCTDHGGLGAGGADGAAAAWVGAVAVCRGADIVASGAGDGVVRLWRTSDGGREGGGVRALESLGGLPVRGFVNSLRIAKSGRFVAVGVGQEPRMGRWLRDPIARNGVIVHPLKYGNDLQDDGDDD